MKIIEPSFEILAMTGHPELPYHYGYKPELLIEAAGRTCYKSEKAINEESAKKFVEMRKKEKHLTVIEHSWEGRLYFDIQRFNKLKKGNWCKYLYFSEYQPLIVGNSRAWQEAIEKKPELDEMEYADMSEADLRTFAHMFDEPFLMCASVRIICDRGVSHEAVRHRPPVFSQESTRYVNYSKKGVQFIKPFWLEGSSFWERSVWKLACKFAELCYNLLINLGWTPQMARSVLHNSTKTEFVITAPLDEWIHILNLRARGTSGRPHPQMVEIMWPLLEEFNKKEPKFFA